MQEGAEALVVWLRRTCAALKAAATPDDPIRRVPNMLFSPHRAGALTFALREIGTRVLEDMDLIARGLPPVACRRAEPETVARMRSMPVAATPPGEKG